MSDEGKQIAERAAVLATGFGKSYADAVQFMRERLAPQKLAAPTPDQIRDISNRYGFSADEVVAAFWYELADV